MRRDARVFHSKNGVSPFKKHMRQDAAFTIVKTASRRLKNTCGGTPHLLFIRVVISGHCSLRHNANCHPKPHTPTAAAHNVSHRHPSQDCRQAKNFLYRA